MNLKVSILIPSYNQEEIIEQTLASALSQTYENIEVVVSDDASIDRTPQILLAWQEKYPEKLKVFLHDQNVGVTQNHTRGLLKCTGDFITFLDGDDLFLPEKIEQQLDFMVSHPEYTITYHDVDVFDTVTSQRLYLWSQRFGTRQGGLKELVRFGNYLPAVAVMVRRENLPSEGYDRRVNVYSDWLLWLQALESGQGRIGYLPNVLSRYRRHTDNLTNSFKWKYIDQNIVLDIVQDHLPQLRYEVDMRRSELYFMQAMHYFFIKKYKEMIRSLIESIQVAFPRMPWVRLLVREVLFFLKNNLLADSILRSITDE